MDICVFHDRIVSFLLLMKMYCMYIGCKLTSLCVFVHLCICIFRARENTSASFVCDECFNVVLSSVISSHPSNPCQCIEFEFIILVC